MLSKKSLHLASQMKPSKNRLLERVEKDLQRQHIYENIECRLVFLNNGKMQRIIILRNIINQRGRVNLIIGMVNIVIQRKNTLNRKLIKNRKD